MAVADNNFANPNKGVFLLHLPADQLVGAGNRDHILYARISQEQRWFHNPFVVQDTDGNPISSRYWSGHKTL